MSRGNSCRSGADYGDFLFLFPSQLRFIGRRINSVGDKPFDGTDADGLSAAYAQIAAAFAFAVTYPRANGGKRIGRTDHTVSFLVFAFSTRAT